MRMCVYPSRGAFLPHDQCSWNKLQHDPGQDKMLSWYEWMIELTHDWINIEFDLTQLLANNLLKVVSEEEHASVC